MSRFLKFYRAVIIIDKNGDTVYADEVGKLLLNESDAASKLKDAGDGTVISIVKNSIASDYSVASEKVGDSGYRLIILENVSERERASKLLSLGEIMPSLAHEMRNPLTGIEVLLDDIHDRMSCAENERHLLRMAISEFERLERMLTDVLTYSGGDIRAMSEENIAAVLSEVLMLNRKLCVIHRVNVQTDIEPDIPHILADGSKLRQAFHNLVINAVQAMESGGNLTVTAKVVDSRINIHFKDTGSGISTEKQHMIFEPFFTDKKGGTGIGLSVVRDIVRRHGGEIAVESEPGKGTDFCITFNL
ncbi:MAG: PAS domain-containing sensor histidine kinase [Deferribacterales bacterium]